MKELRFQALAPAAFAAVALALAVSAGAQTPPAPAPPAAPMTGHQMDKAAGAKSDADMKAECQAMMAKKQEMQDKVKANDAKLDKLVAEMNAAKGSKEMDAMEKPMAAVINELVAQRKSSHSMMMEMQPEMMAHMMRHMDMKDSKGAMACPMMKMDMAHEDKAAEKKPKN